jgi:hypothetical protein
VNSGKIPHEQRARFRQEAPLYPIAGDPTNFGGEIIELADDRDRRVA